MGRIRAALSAAGRWISSTLYFLFQNIPLVGELLSTERRHVFIAGKEFLWTTAAATLPIWFYPLASSWIFRDGPSFGDGVLNSISQGDLYLYSAAIVGPLMFALTTNYAEWNSENTTAPRIGQLTFLFPYGTWFLVISLFIAIFSALFFGFIRYKSAGLITADLNFEVLIPVSVAMYLLANACWYLVSIYKNALVDAAASTSSDEREFVAKFLKGQRHE